MAEGLKQSWAAFPPLSFSLPSPAFSCSVCPACFLTLTLYLSALAPRNLAYLSTGTGFPGGTEVKNLPTSAGDPGDLGSIPG